MQRWLGLATTATFVTPAGAVSKYERIQESSQKKLKVEEGGREGEVESCNGVPRDPSRS